MTHYPQTSCRSCGGAIIWALTDKRGRFVPLDPEPKRFGGNVELRAQAEGRMPLAHFPARGERARLKAAHDADPERNATPFALYVSHYATCPAARSWRQRMATSAAGPPKGSAGAPL